MVLEKDQKLEGKVLEKEHIEVESEGSGELQKIADMGVVDFKPRENDGGK